MKAFILIVSVLAVAGCKPRAYECQVDMECTASTGGFGRCLPGSTGPDEGPRYCAYVDTNCASGLRFDDTAGDHAEDCVDPAVLEPDPADAGVPDGTISTGPDGQAAPVDAAPPAVDAGAPPADAMP